MRRTYVALDLEFTGLDPQRDEIIEIGMVKFRGDEVLDTFSSLVHTQRSLSYRIEQLSGITQADVDGAPPLRSLNGKILAFVQNHPLVGHSIDVDLSFLNRQGPPLQNLAIDTFELASILVPEVKRYSLENLARHLGIEIEEHHRALADATATKDLFLALMARAAGWDQGVLREIVQLAENSEWPMLRVFRDALDDGPAIRVRGVGEGRLRPAPLKLALSDDDWPPLEPTKTITPVDADQLAAMISPEGLVARSFPAYEYRPQQVDMLKAVAEAINVPTHALIEAGTGVGKSLAYLLPAIHFATQNDRRVVISSNTINLQDQLYNKDVPDLQAMLPVPFRAALLKGRNNYLCRRRLETFRRGRRLTVEEARVLAKVMAWLPATKSGDRTELLLFHRENEIWSQIQATSETCLGDRCRFRQEGQCFFYRARSRAERAHLLIINHALLLSDLVLENRILPEFKHLIIDEAHHLEEQATSQFGFEVASQDIYAFLSGLGHTTGGAPGGLLAVVPGLVTDLAPAHPLRRRVGELVERISARVETTERRLFELFQVLSGFVAEHAGADSGQYDQTIRLTSAFYVQPGWSDVEIAYDNLATPLRQIGNDLQKLIAEIEGRQSADELDLEGDEVLQSLQTYAMQAMELCVGMDRILLDPDDNDICWLSIAKRSGQITLHSAPLHVGTTLSETLFETKECVIMTSATLRIGESFYFIKERLGLEDALETALDSPFDYQTAVLLYVPKDIPEPNQPYYQKTIERALIDLCVATEGRALILFTSNSQLHSTYRSIRGALDDEQIIVMGQGIDGSRQRLLSDFSSTPRSVLLGTRSFWEGVDVVGEALSCLTIARLPFAVPTDPIIAARAETFQDPFNEYYLPDAILRFRQGFGRLIRSQNDYGIVVVLDKRILTKSYGKTILRSLPRCTARQGPLERLPILARRWLDPEQRGL